MKTRLLKTLSLAIFLLFAASRSLYCQAPIDFGQSLTGTLPTTSSTADYATPHLAPGDVLFIRVTPRALQIQLELRTPSGILISTIPGGFNDFLQEIYTVPPGGEAGQYKILISNTGIWTGEFCLSLQRMNEPPTAVFLECGGSLDDGLECSSSIRAYKYLVQQGTRSRITVSPGPMIPEVWVCNADGDVLRYGISSFSDPLVLDTIAAPETNCYYVFVADGNGYWDNDFSITHTILSGACAGASIQSSTSSGSICEGDGFTLTASSPLAGASYSWSGPGGFTSISPEVSFDNATVAMSGEYVVTVAAPNTCSSTSSKIITVNPLPDVAAGVDPASGMACEGQDIRLSVMTNASTPATYRWSRLGGGFTSTFSSTTLFDAEVADSDTYVISVTDSKGCSRTDSVEVTVNARPSAAISSPANGAVCREADLALAVTTDAMDASYLWSGPQSFSSTLQDPVIPNVMPVNQGTYSVTVTDNMTGCSRPASRFITVNALPSASISGNLSICAGDSTRLTAFGGGAFFWQHGPNTASIFVSPSETATYTVTVFNTTTGCSDTESATVEVRPLPSIAISSTPEVPEICSGEGNILLCATSDASNPEYEWTGPGFFSTQQCVSFNAPSQTGTYTATVTNGMTGCSREGSVHIEIHDSPVVEISATPPGLSYCDGEDFTLCANSNATSPTYEWDGPGSFTGSTLCVPVDGPAAAQSGTYTVTVTDIHGCTGTDAVVASVDHPLDLEVMAEGGQATALASGGTPPFTYSVFPGGQSNGTGIFQNLPSGTYTFTATDAFGCSVSSMITGTAAPLLAWGVSVSPNPSRGRFEVRVGNGLARELRFDLHDLNGRRLRSFRMETPTRMLDLSDFPDGMYVLRVSDGKQAGVLRLAVLRD
ncbi:MAG: T9SS type A sorting domain-containing protein [Lewinellaceae bacterium]|nr:T9SS type A sorting domain-containing protein [Lewinellaceae bacterium]